MSKDLNPQDLGLGKPHPDLRSYKTVLLNALQNSQSDFIVTDPGGVQHSYYEYLVFLVNYYSGKAKSYTNFSKLYPILSKKIITNIKNNFSECLGPIYIMENLSKGTYNNARIVFPTTKIQKGYDFSFRFSIFNEKKVTVKAPTGYTNTIKPSVIMDSAPFKNYISNSGDSNLKLIYKLFEILDQNLSADGPLEALLYEEAQNNSQNKQKLIQGVTLPLNESFFKYTKRQTIRQKELVKSLRTQYLSKFETLIEEWSKLPTISKSVKDFTNIFLKYYELSAFTLDIDKTTGAPIPTYTNQVSEAYIKGKGRAGSRAEKLGIYFKL